MKTKVDELLKLQELEKQLKSLKSSKKKKEIKEEIFLLKSQIPMDILNRFARLSSRFGNALVKANDGICHGCFINLPSSQASEINYSESLYVCQNCGRFLYLDTKESVTIF